MCHDNALNLRQRLALPPGDFRERLTRALDRANQPEAAAGTA